MARISSPIDAETPAMVSNERAGERTMLRTMMREPWSSQRAARVSDQRMRRNTAGAGGFMACAGGSPAARPTAPAEPISAAARLTPMAIAMADVLGRYSSIGKRNSSVYMRVLMRPSQVPAAMPITLPTSTIPTTNLA